MKVLSISFVAEEYDVSVSEDTPVGTVVVDSLLATDRDVGMNARIRYDITTNLVSVISSHFIKHAHTVFTSYNIYIQPAKTFLLTISCSYQVQSNICFTTSRKAIAEINVRVI